VAASFSPDEINPVRDEIIWTRLIASIVKEQSKQFRSVWVFQLEMDIFIRHLSVSVARATSPVNRLE